MMERQQSKIRKRSMQEWKAKSVRMEQRKNWKLIVQNGIANSERAGKLQHQQRGPYYREIQYYSLWI